jgi:phosphohistidine swiveling domain-containing protein
LLFDHGGTLDAIDDGHIDIHDRQFGLVFSDNVQELATIIGHSHHFPFLSGLENFFQSIHNNRMIIGDANTEGFMGFHAQGGFQ